MNVLHRSFGLIAVAAGGMAFVCLFGEPRGAADAAQAPVVSASPTGATDPTPEVDPSAGPPKPRGSAVTAARSIVPAAAAQALRTRTVGPSRPSAPPHPIPSGDPRRSALDQRWAAEVRDSHWSSATRDYVVDALRDAKVPENSLESIDCRASLCRVELTFASDQEAGSLYDLRHPDHDLTFFRDGQRVTVFFAREGQRIADLLGTNANVGAGRP